MTLPDRPYRRDAEVDILVRGWDNLALTRRCLASIEHNTAGVKYNAIYVDNGSKLHMFAPMVTDFPWVTFLRLPFNHGSVRAINCGLMQALLSPAPYVLLLDNDTAIPDGDHDWLKRFIGYLADPEVAAAGAVTNYVAGLQHAEAVPSLYTRDWEDGDRRGFKDMPDAPLLVSFALLIRKSAIQQAGMFDERFEPGNWEDYDYTLRLRQHGGRLVVAQSVWIHHVGSQTFGKIGHGELMEVNQRRFFDKWGVERLRALGLNVVESEPAPEPAEVAVSV